MLYIIAEIIIIVILCIFIGLRGTYVRRDVFMLFFWIVNLYQSLVATTTCLAMLSSTYSDSWFEYKILFNNNTFLFIHIVFIVNIIFALTELFIPKAKFSYDTYTKLPYIVKKHSPLFKFLGVCFFVSGTIFFFLYYSLSYDAYQDVVYNNNKWVYWLVMVSSCSIFYFAAKKKYILVAYLLFLFGAVALNTTVRQVFFIPMLPLAALYLSNFWKIGFSFKKFSFFVVPAFVVVLLFGLLMNSSKFSNATMLPDAELTPMAINTLNTYDFKHDGYLTFTTFGDFIFGITSPIRLALQYIGITFEKPLALPHITAALMMGDKNLDATVGEWHCPATIYLDFYVSWGWFFPIAVFFAYYIIVWAFKFINKSRTLTILMSFQLMNFIYFFIRGAVDTAAGTLAFPALYLLIILFIYKGNLSFLYKE